LRQKRLAGRSIERAHRPVGEQYRINRPCRGEPPKGKREQSRRTKRERTIAGPENRLPRVAVRGMSRDQKQQYSGRELSQTDQPKIQGAMR